jgi:hypothetical protein
MPAPSLAPNSFLDVNSDDLQRGIQRAEILAALNRAKKGKAVGPDNIPVEVLCNTTAIDYMHTLFTKYFESGNIPSMWQHGIITPIPKSTCKDAREPLNYRGITLTSAVYKLYCSVLESRLRVWFESNDAICDEQNGFRKGRNCVDHLNVITSLIVTRKVSKKHTFAAFVDFSKAYDRVDRTLLCNKLEAYGICGKMMATLRAIYDKVKCNVRVNGLSTQWFDGAVGLKQGCILSPLLFNMYINDLCIAIKATGKGLKVGEETIGILLFADDLVLLAENEKDLQDLLNVLSNWCLKWRVMINSDKTNIVHFRPKGQPQSEYAFECGGSTLAYKDKYRYLGLWLSEYLEYECMAKEVSKAAHRALGLIIAKSKTYGGMPYESFTTLYNACVLPIITYGAAIWGQKHYSCIDAVHNRACRYYLGVNKCTPNSAVQGDMGWKMPLQHQWMAITRQWVRLCLMNPTRLTKRVFLWAHDVAQLKCKKNWVYRCIKYYRDINMDHLAHIDFEFDVKDVLKDIDLVMFEMHEQLWYADLNRQEATRGEGGNKLRTYRKFKNEFKVEMYVKQIMPFPFRSALAKFRCGVAPIRIETGRYGSRRIHVVERLCLYCTSQVEDENHVLMHCKLYDDLREDLMDKAESVVPDFSFKNVSEKFELLLSHENVVSFTAKTLFYMLQRRQAFYPS